MTKRIRSASEAEVVRYWLAQEYKCRETFKRILEETYPDWIGLIDRDDLENVVSNQIRMMMLARVRPFFPDFRGGSIWKVDRWDLIRLGEEDLDKLLLIDAGERREMSGGTLRPIDAARRIDDDATFSRKEIQSDANYIKLHAKELAESGSRIIVIGPENDMLTVVDGVHRITGLFLQMFIRKRAVFSLREAYHGISQIPYDHRFT